MFIGQYAAEIQNLATALHKAYRRLEKNSDNEALHDLRIAVRRIRSLIGPLRSLPENHALREATAAVGRLTTPTRDMEVLIVELQKQGYSALADARRASLETEYRQITQAPEMQHLFAELEQWPAAFARSRLGDDSAELKRTISKALTRQIRKLHAGVHDAEFDRHQLRILVKRTRYLTDAFPSLSPLPNNAAASLKKAQTALGAWHDHFQWCLRVQQEDELESLAQKWADAAEQELEVAETALKKLARLLPSE